MEKISLEEAMLQKEVKSLKSILNFYLTIENMCRNLLLRKIGELTKIWKENCKRIKIIQECGSNGKIIYLISWMPPLIRTSIINYF